MIDSNLIPIVLFAGIFATIISGIYFGNRRKERMALIASGKEASLFNEAEKKPGSASSLKYGLLLVGLGVGALVGEMLTLASGINTQVAYLSMILLFGGISLLIHYKIAKQAETTEK